MSFKFRIGPKGGPNMSNYNEEEEKEAQPKNGWIAMWQSLAGIVFILAFLAYCSREEIVEILK